MHFGAGSALLGQAGDPGRAGKALAVFSEVLRRLVKGVRVAGHVGLRVLGYAGRENVPVVKRASGRQDARRPSCCPERAIVGRKRIRTVAWLNCTTLRQFL